MAKVKISTSLGCIVVKLYDTFVTNAFYAYFTTLSMGK